MTTKKFPAVFVASLLFLVAESARPAPCGPGEPIRAAGDIAFVSREGTATLIGFSEFVTPSLPPKKYLKKKTSGTTYLAHWPAANCPIPEYPTSYTDGATLISIPGDSQLVTWSAKLEKVGVLPDGRVTFRATTSGLHTNPSDGKTEAFPVQVTAAGAIAGNADDVQFHNGDVKALDPRYGSAPFYVSSKSDHVGGGTLPSKFVYMVTPAFLQDRDVWDRVETISPDTNGNAVTTVTGANVRYRGYANEFPMETAGNVDGVPSLANYTGTLRETWQPTSRLLEGTDACFSTPNTSKRARGTYVETLTMEDREADAMGRASIVTGANNRAFQTRRTTGFSLGFSRLEYSVPFDVPCTGDYDVILYYTAQPRDRSVAPVTRTKKKTERLERGRRDITGKIEVGGGQPEFAELDVDYVVSKIELEPACPVTEPGTMSASMRSVHLQFALGRSGGDLSAGHLHLDADEIAAPLFSAGTLQLATTDATSTGVVRDAAGSLRQVLAPQTLADVVAGTASGYEIRFYSRDQVGAADPVSKIHALSGAPFVTYRIVNPDAGSGEFNRLRVVEVRGGSDKITEYVRDVASGVWSISRGGGLQREEEIVTEVRVGVVKTRTVYGADGVPVSVVAKTIQTFSWGDETIREVVDPDGAALTTAYEFYHDVATSDPNHKRLKQRTNADGSWARYDYDAEGRVVKTVRPFLDAPPTTTDEALCRVLLETRDTLADLDGDGRPEVRTTTVEGTLGQETSRRYTIEWSRAVSLGGDLCRRRTDALCVVAGAAWDAASNLVTDTLTYEASPFQGRIRRVVNADGTATLTTYAIAVDGVTTTNTKVGVPNSARDEIVDGRRTISVMNSAGQTTSETVTDLASGLGLSSWAATEFDALGRPTRMDFNDGTYTARTYACCGLASERDRSGVLTTYEYDALGRQTRITRLGMATKMTYDAEGRVLSTTRVGTDGSEMILETSKYDTAGRLIESRDALDRITTFAEEFDAASGRTTRTTTQPDGATSIEISARDGSKLSIGGTGPAPRTFAYGVDANGTYVQEIAPGADASGAPIATEWTKSYTDFAGRGFKVGYADGATSQSFFNAIGQLVRQVDPDGVTSLFAYNARGEPAVTAVDLNRNGNVDYAGADRVVRTTSAIGLRGTVVVTRSANEVWDRNGEDAPLTTSLSEQSIDGLRSWQTVNGLTTTTVEVPDGAGGRTVTTTTPDGVQTVHVFAGDRMISATVTTAAGASVASTTQAYDFHGRLASSTDARNGTTTFSYYADGRTRSVTSPDPDATRAGPGYDSQITLYAYDAAGRVQSVTHPDGGVSYSSYWPNGKVKRTWGTRTFPVEYAYDPQGRVKTLTTWQKFSGDTGRAVTTWNYDPARGFLQNKRYADGTGPSFTYTAAGRLETRTWARSGGVTTTYRYGPGGDLTTTDYADATPDVTFTFDRLGRPTTLADGVGLRGFSYHPSGVLQNETYTAGALDGVAVTRSFDSLLRLSGTSARSGASTLSAVTYGYDAVSRVETVVAGSTTATYGYVANSPLVGRIALRSGAVPRLTTVKTYDRLNRLSAIDHAGDATAALRYGYTYNAANQRTRTTREDDSYWSFTYDELGQVTSGRKSLASAAPVPGLDFAWAFDDIGNRKTATANGSVASYTANALNQYAQRTVPGVVDITGAAGAGTTVTVAVNGGPPQTVTRQGEAFYRQVNVDNAAAAQAASIKITAVKNLVGAAGEDAVTEFTQTALLPKSPETFVHDADGNLREDARWVYSWDAENRLIAQETSPSAAAAGVVRRKLEFVYDGQSRRIAKKVFNRAADAWVLASHTLFVFDGWNLLAEVNALNANAPTRTYVWGLDLSGSSQGAGGVGGLLSVTEAASDRTHFAAYDGNGNIGGLVSAADGTLSARYDYNAFGERTQVEGNFAATNPFGFSTKFTDPETGHLYYGYRNYAPETGRWLNRDPIEEEGGVNVYGFNFNNPIRFLDAGGESAKDLWQIPFTVARGIMGLPFSLASGDIIDGDINTEYLRDSCGVLITINGVRTTDKDAGTLMRTASASPRFKGSQPVRVSNGTHFVVGDFIQVIGQELGAIDVTAVRAANTIRSAADALKKNGCCCARIQVFAHSQGTMIFNRALPLISSSVRSIICFTGIGGQKAVLAKSVGHVENYANIGDLVSSLGNYNPFRILDAPQLINGFDIVKTKSPVESFFPHGVDAHYQSLIKSLKPNCPCFTLK